LTLLACSGAVLVCGLFSKVTIPLLFGNKVNPILELLLPYTIAMACFTVGNTIVVFHQIKHRYLFPVASFSLSAYEIGGIVLHHNSVTDFVNVMTVVGVVCL